MPSIAPIIGAMRYIQEKEPMPSATAGLRTPFERKEAKEAPRKSDPPTTKPLAAGGTLPVATEATPKEKKNAPISSPQKTIQVFKTGTAGIMAMALLMYNAMIAPRNWNKIERIASLVPTFLMDHNPTVMAGLMWAPEISPTIYTTKPRVIPAMRGVGSASLPLMR
jgi:hypothetical protein